MADNSRAEEYMAEQIQQHRIERGWTYSQLAKELGNLPGTLRLVIDPSSLHKIEVPRDGKRRRITVDEALSFAYVFNVPISKWMMRREQLDEMEMFTVTREAWEQLRRVREAQLEYDLMVAKGVEFLKTYENTDGGPWDVYEVMIADETDAAAASLMRQVRDDILKGVRGE